MHIVSMTSGPDGSTYIGDYNLVRRISPDGSFIDTILELESSQKSFEYDLKISPADNMLYVSHAHRHQIWKVLTLLPDEIDDPKNNKEVAVGTGERCLPGDVIGQCGDGGPALEAKLNFPKGVAIAVDKTMYISDSRNIRVVNPDGKIQTLIGHHSQPIGPPRPLDCRRTLIPVSDVQLQWPTRLAINPLDNTLYIVDDTVVFKLTPDMRVHVVAGRSPLCQHSEQSKSSMANDRILSPIADIKFSSSGNLYVVDKMSRESKIHVVDASGAISSPSFDCQKCKPLETISSLAVAPNNDLLFNSVRKFKIFKLKTRQMSTTDPDDGDMTIVRDPVEDHVYKFNRFGQHLSTHHSQTGALLYSFVYSKNTVFGRLSRAMDGLGNKLNFKRDYTNRVQSIENTLGQKFSVRLSILGHLEGLELSHGEVRLNYNEETGLLLGKRFENGNFVTYSYDEFGRAVGTSLASGDLFEVREGCSGRCKSVLKNGREISKFFVHPNGEVRYETNNFCDTKISSGISQVSSSTSLCTEMSLTRTKNDLNLDLDLGQAWKLWSWKSQNVVQKAFQEYSGSRLEISYHKDTESVKTEQGQTLLTVGYVKGLLPTYWSSDAHLNCSQTYNRLYQLKQRDCQRGIKESFTYNERNGLLETVKRCQRQPIKYLYGSKVQFPREIVLSSGHKYVYNYDNHGGLSRIQLPLIGVFSMQLQPGINGRNKINLMLPGFIYPMATYWSQDNLLLGVRLPGAGSLSSVYSYDGSNRMTAFSSGYFQSSIKYDEDGRVLVVDHEQIDSFSSTESVTYYQKDEFEREDGLIRFKEHRIAYNAKSGFASAKFSFNILSGKANTVVINGMIGGKTVPYRFANFGSHLMQRNAGQFLIRFQSLNETTISDNTASFFKSSRSESLLINGRQVFTSDYSLDGCNRIQIVRQTSKSLPSIVINYKYDDDGQLISQKTNDESRASYSYDPNGNLIGVIVKRGKLETIHDFKFNEKNQAVDYRKNQLGQYPGDFDSFGRMVKNRNRHLYKFSTNDLLVEVRGDRQVITYHYDHLGRLIGQKDSTGTSIQYFYAHPTNPYLVSHVYKPREGALTLLVYDDENRLIFAQVGEQAYYVVTDKYGSPILFYTSMGNLARQIVRLPFGHVTDDSSPHLGVPIGFGGAIYDETTETLHFQVRGLIICLHNLS